MKLKNILIGSMIFTCLIITSCGNIDNYSMPNAGVNGKITNTLTGVPIQTEQPNGIKIRLLEEKYGSSVIPYDFWCKADGSFENTAIFSGKYKVIPVEGAFFPADTAEVTINGLVTINFKVTPFLTVKASVAVAAGSVTTTYTISRDKVGDKIMNCSTFVSAYPSVCSSIYENNTTNDVSGTADESILSKQFTDVVSGLKSGSTYYVRVGARTNNTYNKYNYSEIMKVVIP